MGRTSTRQLATTWASVGMLLLWLDPIWAVAQSSARFPHPADPQYQRTYQAYRDQVASRPIVAPALGYHGSESQENSPRLQLASNPPSQGGIGGVFSSVGESFKQGWNKVGQLLTPQEKVEKASEPTSVFNQAHPSADTYAAMARLCVESGRLVEAEQHYRNALRANPRHLGALLGYAKLKEMQGRMTEAIQIYQRVLSFYPQEPSALNNAGLCYARNGQLSTAVALLHRAVQLQPKKALYRNNLAMVLVEMDRPDTALAHLRAVYPEAVARYNLGQLLLHKGQWEAAAEQFTAALEVDPSMRAAQAWLEELARRKTNSRPNSGAEIARLPRHPGASSGEGAWSEISDLPSGVPTDRPNPSSSLGRPSPNQGAPSSWSGAPQSSVRLEHPRIYASPGGTYSADPPSVPLPAEEELAPLPPVDPTQR